ncbi:MAG: phage terminase large subunit family protein [Christensenellales bacterium]
MALQELAQLTLDMFRPPVLQTVSQWADANRILVPESSAEPGPWRTSRAPYMREIMDSFTDPDVWKIVMMTSTQVGKTEMSLNMLGRSIDVDPGPALFVQPSKDFAEDFSKRRVAPMIAACRPLKRKVYEAKSRDSGNTITMKTFPGGSVALTGANSPTELAGRPIRYAFMDEVDRYPKNVGVEGGPVGLVEKRTDTFRHNRKVVLTSSPTVKGASKIESEYLAGTREEWHVACPHCGEYSFIRFENIRFEKEDFDENGEKGYRVTRVAWRCPICERETGEHTAKRQPAKWVAKNPDAIINGVRSFHLNAFVSPWSDWKAIVLEFLNAKDDPERLKLFYNTTLAQSWEMRDRSGKPEKLHQRREHYNAEVPTGVLVLTCGIDTQDNRLEYEVVGWNRHEESWGIDRGIIPGRPDSPGVWKEVDALLDREWKMANGMAMRILATFVDSGGHFTDAVYKACEQRASRRIWPVKGESGEGKPYVRLMKSSARSREGVKFIIGVDSGKEAVLYATGIETPGPRYMHFPVEQHSGYDLEYFRGLISEKLRIIRRGGRNVLSWEKIYERNEPLDCRNYARAAYKYFNWNFDRQEQVLSGQGEAQPITRAQAEKKKKKLVISPGISI